MHVTQGLKRAAQINRNGLASICGSRQFTWVQTRDRVAQLAGGLQSLGVAPEDRVAVLALNCDRYLELYYATPWAAGVVVPINYRLAGPEMAYCLNDSEASVLCVDDALLEVANQLRPHLPHVRHMIYIGEGDTPEGMIGYEDLIAQSKSIPDAHRGYEDLFGLFYTGGTTGKPKGVMLTHSNICGNALPVIGNMHYTPNTRYLHAAPMFHAADCGSTFAITTAGGCHCYLEKFHPEELLKRFQELAITSVMLVPTMLNMMVHHPRFNEFDLSTLTDVIYGAAPMPESLIRHLLQTLPRVRFTQCLGMTEMSPVITCLYPHHHVLEGKESRRLQSVGQAAQNVEVRIVDENDQEVPPETVGEILCRGTPLMKGYWKQAELTKETLRGGWLHTGDAGLMDEDGYIYVVDRVKDMIISGGENVYSTEVESAIYRHPSIKECAVIGLPHDIWGEAVHAVAVLKPHCSATEEEIIEHCKDHIAGYKCPRTIEFRSTALPLSGAGKVLKTKLREESISGANPT